MRQATGSAQQSQVLFADFFKSLCSTSDTFRELRLLGIIHARFPIRFLPISMPDLVVADAEESQIDKWIVKIGACPAQFISADIPVLVMVPTCRAHCLVIDLKQSKTVETRAEYLI